METKDVIDAVRVFFHKSEMSIATLSFLAVLGLVFIWFSSSKPKKFPPGPPTVPILGSIPFVPKEIFTSMADDVPRIHDWMADNFGPIAGYYEGRMPVVFISDLKVIRYLFKMKEVSDRGPHKPFDDLRGGSVNGSCRGLIFNERRVWEEQRRFALKSLRDMGFGKSSMQDSIVEEIDQVIEELKKKDGQVIDLLFHLNIAAVNALWKITTGEKMDMKDPKLLTVVKLMDDIVSSDRKPSLFFLSIHPWLVKKFDMFYKENMILFNTIKGIIKPYIEEHRDTYTGADRDFIDVYLKEINMTTDKTSSFYGQSGIESLLAALIDLFVAGIDTTTASLMWGFLLMAKHPEIQAKVHEEIDSVLSKGQKPTIEDRERLPYTHSVIKEFLRVGSIGHGGLAHVTSQTIKVGDYVLPKGCRVSPNLLRIHHDPELWDNPHQFNPKRFYDEKTNKVVKNDNLVPFSVGKRICLGQSLAELQLFLFFTCLMQTFSFQASPDHPLPSAGYLSGTKRSITRKCKPYKVVLRDRSKNHHSQ